MHGQHLGTTCSGRDKAVKEEGSEVPGVAVLVCPSLATAGWLPARCILGSMMGPKVFDETVFFSFNVSFLDILLSDLMNFVPILSSIF